MQALDLCLTIIFGFFLYFQLFDGGYQPGIYKPYYYDDRICGREPPLLNITQSNFMYVLFHSENNVRPGFELRYNFTRG